MNQKSQNHWQEEEKKEEMYNNDIDNYEDQDELNKYLDKQNKISLNQFNNQNKYNLLLKKHKQDQNKIKKSEKRIIE